MNSKLAVVIASLVTAIALSATARADKGKVARPVIKPAADVKWTPLVPELGDKGPQISVVFGDLKKGPVGLLMKNPAGARPGPHTHTSDYWAVVVSGQMQDFLPGEGDSARKLGAGSWWKQPGKAAHDNHCVEGSECVAFIYMPKGFDFAPVMEKKASR
jgi:uncharacterized protein DUF4437